MTTFAFDFQLSRPLTYSHQGEQIDAVSLTLQAPTGKSRMEVTVLKKGFKEAIGSMQAKVMQNETAEEIAEKILDARNQSSDDDNDMTGSDICELIMMYGEFNIRDYHECFKKLLCANETCMVDGNVKMTAPIYESMLFADIEKLLGEYLKNFLA